MPKLIAAFLRHGDYQQLGSTPSAWQPFALTDQGELQAKHAAESLLNYASTEQLTIYPIIDCSSLLRAWQTADIIRLQLAKKLNRDYQLEAHDALCERSVGSVANLSITQIESILETDPRYSAPPNNWKSDSHYCLPFPGAESLMNSGQRVATHLIQRLEAIWQTCKEDTLFIVVGHGASFRHAAYQLGLLSFEQISQLSMYHATPIFLEQIAHQKVQHIDGKWKIRSNKDQLLD